MGDPNASIPTPQPVHYRPMFGAYGGALAATGATFVSQAALDDGIAARLGLAKTLLAVRNTARRHFQGEHGAELCDPTYGGRSRNPTRFAPMASFSPANRRPYCRWRSAYFLF
jgi:hypothetical protein